jgi:osmoprotectant transport system permease protein
MSGILDVFRRPDFFELLWQHILLSAAALLIAVAIALPVALAIRNTSLGAALAVNIGNIGRAVPSLAILALCQPFLGFGFDTALVALTALAIPPILINTSTGSSPASAPPRCRWSRAPPWRRSSGAAVLGN